MAVTVSLGRRWANRICSIFFQFMETKTREKSTNTIVTSRFLHIHLVKKDSKKKSMLTTKIQSKIKPPLAEVNWRIDIFCLLLYGHLNCIKVFFCKITAVYFLCYKCKKTITVISNHSWTLLKDANDLGLYQKLKVRSLDEDTILRHHLSRLRA